MITLLSEVYESLPSQVPTNRATMVWPGMTHLVRERLLKIGAGGALAWVWSFEDQRDVRRVALDHEAFEPVALTLEQFNLVVSHLPSLTTSDALFCVAAAVADGVEVGLVYDHARNRMLTPHAQRKAVAA
jgi:hypothetical protein